MFTAINSDNRNKSVVRPQPNDGSWHNVFSGKEAKVESVLNNYVVVL